MTEEEIDQLCFYLDDLLLEGSFEKIDQWYAELLEDGERLHYYVDEDLSLGLTILMVSLGGEDKLPHRQKFYHYLRDHLESRMSDEDVKAHLGGLEGKKIDLRANRDWLQANSDQYEGKWVAVKDGTLITSADSADGLVQKLEKHPSNYLVTKL